MKILASCLILAASQAACVGADDDETIDVIVGDGKADTSTTAHLSSGKTVTVKFTAAGGPLDVTVDCGAPSSVDSVGTQFTVTSPALGQSSASSAMAGYYRFVGDVDGGQQQLRLRGKSGYATCRVNIATASGSCTDAHAFRSPQTGHTHLAVGTHVASGFPVSGNHWGAWAKWGTVYRRPVLHGFLLHNLEHGGIVLSYGCSAPTDSAECAQAASDLTDLANAFGESRVIVTPDPEQPDMYAARTWRMGFSSSCFDQERMLGFLGDNFRNGREDEDSSPPLPFDPTTPDVPCQDLMAAPDSCN